MAADLRYDQAAVDAALAFTIGIMEGRPGRELVDALRADAPRLTPHDILRVQELRLDLGHSVAEIKATLGKVCNVVYPFMREYDWERPGEGTFLGTLLAEDEALRAHLDGIKAALRRGDDREGPAFQGLRADLLERFSALRGFDAHYAKKENLLFPVLERTWASHRFLGVMWSLHDDIRRTLAGVIALLERDDVTWEDLKRPVGDYFFQAYGTILKEELILFPAAADAVPAQAWEALHRQSFEYPFPLIEAPEAPAGVEPAAAVSEDLLQASTGSLSAEQLLLLLDALPVDLTLVDHEDKVRFFTRPADRVFARSPAIIGRDVRNCHPPESVHVVEQIIDAFRAGEQDEATFWIRMGGRLILIRYFPLRSEAGEYRGVVEVSQDVTGVAALEGERRLLDW